MEEPGELGRSKLAGAQAEVQAEVAGSELSEPLAYRSVRGSLWLMASSYWTIGFGFIANIVLTRLLTPEIYGEFALALFFSTLFQLRAKLGLKFAFAQQTEVTGRTVGTYYVLDVLLGTGAIVLTAVCSPLLLYLGYSSTVLLFAAVMVGLTFLDSLHSVFSVVLERRLHLKPVSVISSVAFPLSYVPAFFLALRGMGRYSLIAQFVCYSLLLQTAEVVYLLVYMRGVLALKWSYSRGLARQYLTFGFATGASDFLSQLSSQLDNFLLGTIAGARTLGYYDRAYRTSQWPSLLLSPLLGRSVVYTYSSLKGDRARLQKTFRMISWLCLSASLPLSLAVFISAPDLILLAYGPRWMPVVLPLRILVVMTAVRLQWESLVALFVGLGQPKRAIRITIIQLVVMVATGVPLSIWWGTAGMAIAVLLAGGSAVILGIRTLRRHAQLRSDSVFGGPVGAVLLTTVCYLILARVVDLSQISLVTRLAGTVALTILGFSGFLFLLRPRQSRERLLYVYRLARKQNPGSSLEDEA